MNRKSFIVILFSLTFANYMGRLDTSIVNISLPVISDYFKVSTSGVSWVVLIYMLFLTSSLLICGKVADKVGLKKTFISGYIIFSIGSLLCGLSPTIYILVASRALQGLGGAMFTVAAFALIPKCLPHDKIGSAFGLLAMGSSLGLTTGAPLGGIISGLFSWQWIFYVNIPIGIVASFLAYRYIPPDEVKKEKEKLKFNYLGSASSFISILFLLLFLNLGNELGWLSIYTILFFVIFVISLYVFIASEKKSSDPLLDLSLLSSKNYASVILGTLFGAVLLSGSNFLLPFYLQGIDGLSSELTGVVYLCYSVTILIASPFAGKISDKVKPIILCQFAMILLICGILIFVFTMNFGGLFSPMILLFIMGIGYAFYLPPNNNQLMRLAPEGKQGGASGMVNTTLNFSFILGVVIFDTVFSNFMGSDSANLKLILKFPDVALNAFKLSYLVGVITCSITFLLLFSVMLRKRKSELKS
jgi:EmrB/QacA subfamily drug resistance transporter